MRWISLLLLPTVVGCHIALVDAGHINVPGVDTKQEVFIWVANSIQYVEEDGDDWQMPDETLRTMSGDCEDHAILAVHMLHEIGYDATLVYGATSIGGTAHAWVLVDGENWESTLGLVNDELPSAYPALRSSYTWEEAILIASMR